MNYLVHLYLSDPDPLCRLGNLMGDFIKGRLENRRLPAGLLRGLRQHRTVDRLAIDHPAVRRSRDRLDNRFGHFRGILVDIFYDHLLARNWVLWGDGRLDDFAAGAYKLLQRHEALLDETFRPVARRMVRYDWLTAYRNPGTIKTVLGRMAKRLRRPNPLDQGHTQLVCCGVGMAAECLAFLKDAQGVLAQQRHGQDVEKENDLDG